MRNLLYIAINFLFLSIISSCQKTPSYVIPQGEMEKVLLDIHLADAIIQNDPLNYNTTQQKEALYESVFQKHDITKHQFDTSLYWYGMHSEQYVKMYEHVIKRLSEEKKDIDKHINIADRIITVSGDTANIWRQEEWKMFYPTFPHANQYTFEIKTDTAYHSFDTYKFNMIVKGLQEPDSSALKSQMNIIFRYSKDSINVKAKEITNDGTFTFEIKSDSLVPEKIYGNLFMNLKKTKQPVFIDSIQFIRIHKHP